MRLYYSSTKPLGGGFERCKSSLCITQGFGVFEHITLSTKPLGGKGPFLFVTDVPQLTVARYEYRNPFQREGGQFFAVPTSVASSLRFKPIDFYEAASSEWNIFHTVIVDRPTKAQAFDDEKWNKVWMSRSGIATAEIIEHIDDYAGTRMKARIKLTDSFNPETDYLIVEERWQRILNHNVNGWKLRSFAGYVPRWAAFPWEWNRWVMNKKVLSDACRWIKWNAPFASFLVDEALEEMLLPNNRLNAGRKWAFLASEIGRHYNKSLGQFNYQNDTLMRSMPMKIASRLVRVGGEQWVPSIPKPEHQRPEDSGRVLLVDEEGIHDQPYATGETRRRFS